MRTEVWSCGGGVQSAAIAALIVSGRLPKPDMAVIADTGREKSTTWAYLDGTLNPELSKVGVSIVRVDKDRFATVDLYRNADILLPMYTENGKLPTLCSNEWKRRVIMRYLRSVGVKEARCWMGISADEVQRVRSDSEKWFEMWYPLVFEIRMRRQECINLVKSMGWPDPPRSSCWMCPNMGNDEWRGVPEAEIQKAAELERNIQKLDAGLFLHKSRRPISERPFDEDTTNDLSECQTGFCFV